MKRYTLETTQAALDTSYVEACWPVTDRPDFPAHDELRWSGEEIEAVKDGQVVATITLAIGHNHTCGACGKVVGRGDADTCEVDADHDFALCDKCATTKRGILNI